MAGRVQKPLCLTHVAADRVVPAIITYRAADPFAVELKIGPLTTGADGPVIDWVFDRSLLHDAFRTPGEWVGNGDVRTQMFNGRMWIALESHDGECTLRCDDTGPVTEFLWNCDRLVPYGKEPVDAALDAVLAQWLEAA